MVRLATTFGYRIYDDVLLILRQMIRADRMLLVWTVVVDSVQIERNYAQQRRRVTDWDSEPFVCLMDGCREHFGRGGHHPLNFDGCNKIKETLTGCDYQTQLH